MRLFSECNTANNETLPGTRHPGAIPYISMKTAYADAAYGENNPSGEAHAKLGRQLEALDRLIESFLEEDGGGEFARAFMAQKAEANCSIAVDSSLTCTASYTSHTFFRDIRGFANRIAVHPEKSEDLLKLADAIVHEYFHVASTRVAPVLKHKSDNPDTQILIHPEDWILVENICERIAGTGQAECNFHISKIDPRIAEITKKDVVFFKDFEEALQKFPDRERALMHMAQIALDRYYNHDTTFVQYYTDVALNNFKAGMVNRHITYLTDDGCSYLNDDGSKPYVEDSKHREILYVRVEAEDLWQIGNHGIGPNPLGVDEINAFFKQRPILTSAQQTRLNAIMAEYAIPPLESCPTLFEAVEPKAPVEYRQHTVFSNPVVPAQFVPAFV